MNRNRLHNMSNPSQGDYKKVLCVCSAGLLRSPSAALVLSQPPFDFNTRAAGMSSDFALVIVDEYLLAWADQVVCMTPDQKVDLMDMVKDMGVPPPIVCLEIEDSYDYRDPRLMKMIAEKYTGLSK